MSMTAPQWRECLDPTDWQDYGVTGHDRHCHVVLWADEPDPPCTCGWEEDEPRWLKQIEADIAVLSRLAFVPAPKENHDA